MGILNLSPDSFYDGGKHISGKQYIEHAGKMIAEGAAIIDIGGQSTRPGAELLSDEEEWSRVQKPLSELKKEFPQTIFSIDTFHSSVAARAVKAGVSIINDISGGNMDKEMFSTVAELKVPYIVMHMQGTPQTMQINPVYDDVVMDVLNFFNLKIDELKDLGLPDIIIDPGFGFGKTLDQNYLLLKHLSIFKFCKVPIIVGLSRKSMISNVISETKSNSLNGTTVLNTIALMKGADILRVHDVKEAVEAVNLIAKMQTV